MSDARPESGTPDEGDADNAGVSSAAPTAAPTAAPASPAAAPLDAPQRATREIGRARIGRWTAVVVGIAAVALLGGCVELRRLLARRAADAVVRGLEAANAPAEEWVAAMNAHPRSERLAFLAGQRLESAAARERGNAPLATGLYEQAAEAYRRAAALNPFAGLTRLRLARTLVRTTRPADRARVAPAVRDLVTQAFATSPTDPSVIGEAFDILLLGLDDVTGAAELARGRLAARPEFIDQLAESCSAAGVPADRVVAEFLPPPAPGTVAPGPPLLGARRTWRRTDASVPPITRLAAYYIDRILIADLADLARHCLAHGHLEELRAVAADAVELLASAADTYDVAIALWRALFGTMDAGWPEENLLFGGDLDRRLVEGGFAPRLRAAGAFFHDWHGSPEPAGTAWGDPTATGARRPEVLCLGRHPHQTSGFAQVSQLLPTLAPGTYRLTFQAQVSRRSMTEALRVRVVGQDVDGAPISVDRTPRLGVQWGETSVALPLPQGLVNGQLILRIESRDFEPTTQTESVCLDRLQLVPARE